MKAPALRELRGLTRGALWRDFQNTEQLHQNSPYYKGWFTPWTMKLSQGPARFVIGCWTRPGTTSGYTKENMSIRVIMEFEVPKRHILRSTLSTVMVQRVLRWEGERGALVEKSKGPWHSNIVTLIFWWNFFWGKRRWRQENTKECSNLNLFFIYFSKIAIYGHIFF